MEIDEERIAYAIAKTEILRFPKQTLATFGITNIYYYLVTEPSYSELVGEVKETVVREGRVIAERPRVVTPFYLLNLEGFSESAGSYLERIRQEYGPHAPGLFYTYKNERGQLTIVSDDLAAVVDRLNAKIEKEGDPLSAIIKGVDELWDVSLLKFVYDITEGSVRSNVWDLGVRGLLDIDSSGVPLEARYRVEELFDQVRKGEIEPSELKRELDRWNLFREYEDRFLSLFRRRS
jgi:hypothetical protein